MNIAASQHSRLTISKKTLLLISVCTAGIAAIAFSIQDSRKTHLLRRVIISIDQREFPVETRLLTVRDALAEQGFHIQERALIFPPLETALRDGLTVLITNPLPVTLEMEGKTRDLLTHTTIVSGLLLEEGITVGSLDEVIPHQSSRIVPGMHITVRRVREFEEVRLKPIAFETLTEKDPALSYGKSIIIQEGKEGEKEIKMLVRVEDGVIIKETVIDQRIISPPIAKKVRVGTRIAIGKTQKGIASWYRHSGGLTAASTEFPRGSYVRVRCENSGTEVIVRITDYGPLPSTGRVIDLERDAFIKLAPLSKGLIPVTVEEIITQP